MKRRILAFALTFTFVLTLVPAMPSITLGDSVYYNCFTNEASARSFDFFRQLREDFKRDQEREMRRFARDVSRDYYSFLRKRIRDSYQNPSNRRNNVTNVTINVNNSQKLYSFTKQLDERELEELAKIVEYSPSIGINDIPFSSNYELRLIRSLCSNGQLPYRFIKIYRNNGQLVAAVERIE